MNKILKSAVTFLLTGMMTIPQISFADSDDKSLAYAEFISSGAKTSNMNVHMGNDTPVLAEREGRCGWVLSNHQNDISFYEYNAPEATINVDLGKGFAYDEPYGSTYEVEVDYYDEKCAVFSLVYSAQDRSNRYAGCQYTEGMGAKSEINTGIKAWRTRKFLLQDAKFDDSLNGVDIMISANIMNLNHGITNDTDSGYGRNYSNYEINRKSRVSTVDDILIGAIRVKKLDTVNPLDVKITSENYGNNFFEDEPVKLDFSVENKTDKAYELKVDYYAINDDGIKAADMQGSLSIGAYETKTYSIVQEDLPYGLFKYYASFSAEGISNVTSTEIARIREAETANPRAGINVHFEGLDEYPGSVEATVTLAKKAGFASLRDASNWGSSEVNAGQFKLKPTTKEAIDFCKKVGIEYMPVLLMYNTAYITKSSDIMTEKFQTAFYRYVVWLTQQFKGVTSAIEQQNEINHIFPNITGEEYAKLMEIMYKAVKSVDPEIKVVGVDTGLLDLALVRRFFEGGSLDYMDAVSWHPYDWARSFEQGNQMTGAPSVQALMEEFGGGNKEKWVTETGWHRGLGNRITEEDVGYYLPRALMMNDALKVYEMVHFYEFLNGGIQPSYGECFYGIVKSVWDDVPFAALPSYVACANANKLLGGAEFDTTINGAPGRTDEIYVYRWKRNNADGKGKHLLALWTCNDREKYGLKLNKDEVTYIDHYGNEGTMKAVDGVFNFALNDRPVYLIGDFDYMEKAEPTIGIDSLISSATVNDTIRIEMTCPSIDGAKLVPKNADFEVVENTGFVNGKATYVLSTPDKRYFNKKIKFDVETADGKLLYAGTVKINNEETITVKETHTMNDKSSLNRWQMEISVTNNMNSAPVNGIIKINAPSDITKYVRELRLENLAPKKTHVYKMFMPELVSKNMRRFDIEVRLDTGEILRDAHTMFFTIAPYAHKKPVIDGRLGSGEWSSDTWFSINGRENVQLLTDSASYMGDADLSGKATAMYDEENVYFFIEIEDDVFVQKYTGEQIWNGDSIQIGLSDETVQNSGTYTELTVALTSEGPQMYRHLTNSSANPTGLMKNAEMQIIRDGTKIYYELAIPWSEVLQKPDRVKVGYVPKFAFLINDDDGFGRNKYMEYSQTLGAIGTYKNVGFFSDMNLADK